MADKLALIESKERHALAGSLGLKTFDLHLQAKINLDTARVGAFELLLRADDDNGPVSPAEVISRMRQKDLAFEFTCALANRTVDISKTLHAKGLRVPVAMNLDEPEVEIEGLPARLIEIFQRAPTAQAVEIEITETDRSVDPENIALLLEPFAECGVLVWMDDACLTQEDLHRIHTLPFRGIKLDRSLLVDEKTAKRAFRHARHHARQHGIEHIVAEGIETEQQLNWCLGQGIPIGQGYRFHRPAPMETTLAQLA